MGLTDKLTHRAAWVVAGFTFLGTYLASSVPSITKEVLSLVSSLISGILAQVMGRTLVEAEERSKRIHQHIDPHLTRTLSILGEIPSRIAQLVDFRKDLRRDIPMDERAQEAYNEWICTRLRQADTVFQIVEDEGGFSEIEVLEKTVVAQIQSFRERSVDYMAINVLLGTPNRELQALSSDIERTRELLTRLKLK